MPFLFANPEDRFLLLRGQNSVDPVELPNYVVSQCAHPAIFLIPMETCFFMCQHLTVAQHRFR